jgi:phosphate transport system substrate-binding protein
MENRIIYKYHIKHTVRQSENIELFIGEHLQLGKRFFLKSMTPANDADNQFRDRFYDEAKLLARLNHPNILQATDFFQLEDRYYLAMEYFSGPTLEKMIHFNKQFPEKHALKYFKQLLRGLSFAHDNGVVHRNMRPSMILLNRQGDLKISDFGVAMILGKGQREELGNVEGDAGFMSPEQIINPKNVDQRSDIYSAGIILFQMLSGKLPFEQGTGLAAMMLHLDKQAPDVRSINPHVPEKLAIIIAKALEKSPDNRYQTCQEFLHDLEGYQKSLLIESTDKLKPMAVVEPKNNRRPYMIAGAILGVLLVIGLATYKLMTRQNYVTALRIHGSNTIGSKLAPALAEAYLKKVGATQITREPGKNVEEILIKGVISSHDGIAIEIKSHGSSTAFEGLGADKCDIGMSSRRIKDDESKKLAALGDMNSLTSEHILGLDGLAVIVNDANPLTSLSIKDIKGAFSGAALKWSDMGGGSTTINLYARDDKSGTFDTFKSLVLGDSKLNSAAKRFEDSSLLSSQVASDKDAIGFIGLPYIKSAKAVSIKSGASLPIFPTSFTVATEDYPLARRLYFYTAQQPKNKRVNEFIEFSLSAEGQEIVEKTGFVPLTVRAGSFTPPESAPAEYKSLTTGAERLSLNFKFQKSSFKLDNKGQRDIDRLIRALASKEFLGRPVMLFGFTDNSQADKESEALSRSRAQAVANELVQRGVTASVVAGFGSRITVADNSSAEGKNRNNRVEIWLARK